MPLRAESPNAIKCHLIGATFRKSKNFCAQYRKYRKLFIYLHCDRKICRHIESVFRTPYLKMWKFSELREERIALISCIYRYGTSCALLSYTMQVWGIIIVCFSSGIPQPSSRHSRINSTLSFCK